MYRNPLRLSLNYMYEFLDLHGLYLHVGTCNQLAK